MDRRTRVLTTLEFREPDRVPITEMSIDAPHLEALSKRRFGGSSSLQTQTSANRLDETRNVDLVIECYRKLGFDLVPCRLSAPDGWKPRTLPDGMIVDEWGRVLTYDAASKAWVPFQTIFKSIEDFEDFTFPEKNAPGRVFSIDYMRRRVKEELAVASFIRDPFAHAWEMFTPTNFVKWLYEEPTFIERVIQILTDFNLEMIKRVGEVGVDLIISGGDYAEKKGPMTSLEFFKKVVFPNLKKQVEAAHKIDVKFIKHTDGNINPLLEDLASIVDGIHSLDPTAGMDIGYIKERYRDKLILIGNIAVDSLCLKTKKEVIDETKSCLRKAAPGGGYILSSSNSWYTDAKLENCLAMIETAKKYGTYPIAIQ